ncbi:hypothetical protein AHMF7605_11245 [Adhaeribacter arboris]|uniref:Uncharacterized protein n=1 Tax=Adhaeribacter arboris TaxID=2072846 RepID=A0A2T2YEW3_9BACT|nr:hypothetical protein [Adhaeribacter arboris]PSR54055.1 hypothetical protein AHMF7605_11245 [Adhaeribacter arboris]
MKNFLFTLIFILNCLSLVVSRAEEVIVRAGSRLPVANKAKDLKFGCNQLGQAEADSSYSGRVRKVISGRIIHRFFDTSPLSPSGRYLALFRFPSESESPKPGRAGDVVLVDMQTNKERVVAQSRGYEMQMGANVQWGSSDQKLYFNDVDTTTWKAFAVQLNPFSGKAKRMSNTVFMVSNNGKYLVSYNLVSSRFAQVGYGVVLPDNLTKRNIGPVETDGLDITTVATNKTKRIATIRQIYEQSVPSIKIPNPEEHEFYLFQVKWNPQGTRLLTTIQWSPVKGGSRRRAVITMRPDGSDIRTAITPEQWSKGGHHVNWMPDGERISMNLNVDGQPGLEFITAKYDGSDLKVAFTPGSGHPSYHPAGLPLVITDAYPDEPIAPGKGISPIRLLNTYTGQEEEIFKIFVSDTQGEFRIDPHPAWDRIGGYVIFNGYEGNTRNVFIADLKDLVTKYSKNIPAEKQSEKKLKTAEGF